MKKRERQIIDSLLGDATFDVHREVRREADANPETEHLTEVYGRILDAVARMREDARPLAGTAIKTAMSRLSDEVVHADSAQPVAYSLPRRSVGLRWAMAAAVLVAAAGLALVLLPGSHPETDNGAANANAAPVQIAAPVAERQSESFQIAKDVTYVDFAGTTNPEGTEGAPFSSLAEGLKSTSDHGVLVIKSGHSNERPRLDKPVVIKASGGPVRIGD